MVSNTLTHTQPHTAIRATFDKTLPVVVRSIKMGYNVKNHTHTHMHTQREIAQLLDICAVLVDNERHTHTHVGSRSIHRTRWMVKTVARW